jgi:hypothetical protein
MKFCMSVTLTICVVAASGMTLLPGCSESEGPPCSNGILDNGETGVDCGGACGVCPGSACSENLVCSSQSCVGGFCAVATCTDGLQNGSERGIDCGGICSVCVSAGDTNIDGSGDSGQPEDVDDTSLPPVSVEIELQTGVLSWTADLVVLPVTMRLYLDWAIDPFTGDFVVLASLARLRDGEASDYAEPDGFLPETGTSAFAFILEGAISEEDEGVYRFSTSSTELSFLVVQTIVVRLDGFKLEGVISTQGAPTRDGLSGTMTTTGGGVGVPGTEETQLDPIRSSFVGSSFLESEIPEAIPRVCEADPCKELNAAGGNCTIEGSWNETAVCL